MKKKLSLIHLVIIILLLAAAFIIVNNTSYGNVIKEKSAKTIPDLQFGNTPDQLYDYLQDIEEVGRSTYRDFILIFDFAFPVSYSLLTYLILLFFIQRISYLPKPIKILKYLPFLIGIIDIIENICNLTMIHSYPDRLNSLMYLSVIATSVKMISFILFILLLLITVGFYYINRNRLHTKESL